jgi:hypothetical protein
MKQSAKTYPPGKYQCPACYSTFDDYAAYNQHRITTHGRDGNGMLVNLDGTPYAATPTIDMELTILRELAADVARWRETGGDPRDLRYILETLDRWESLHANASTMD